MGIGFRTRSSVKQLSAFGHAVAYQTDQRAVPGGTGGDQRAMGGMRPMVAQWPAGKVSHHAAGFVHQKVGCCKVPGMTAAGGEGSIEFSMRYAG
jgi:hypothetical protein